MEDKIIYAVIQLGAKQYLVKKGDLVIAEKQDAKAGETLKVKEVLLGYDGKVTKIGDPYLENAVVELEIQANTKGPKIRVAKFKAKSRYRRVTGHRQNESQLVVKTISL